MTSSPPHATSPDRDPVGVGAFAALSFDCYGTLIDWETGLGGALAPWRERTRVAADDGALLAAFAEQESAIQSEYPSMPYPDILSRVLIRIGDLFGAPALDREAAAFGASIGDWPAFADSAPALARLATRFRLFVLSNVDRASFALSESRLGVRFDGVFTAQDIGSYKPDPRNFDYLLARLGERGIAPGAVLHVAQSLFHDIVPARAKGLATAWIDRQAGRPGATPPPAAPVAPDFRFPSLAALADAAA